MTTENQKIMPTALILADQVLDKDLQTIFGEKEKSSLIIAGYSLMEHLLIELRDLNFTDVIILAKRDAQQLQTLVGDPQRWGMTVNVMTFSLNKNQVLQEYKSLSEPNGLLVIEMNQLRSHCINDFLEQSQQSNYSLLEAVTSGKSAGLTLLKPTTASFIINPMPIELDNISINPLITSHDFHRANFDVIAGLYNGLAPSVQHNSTTGRRQHWASYVHKKSILRKDSLMIDRHCRVGRNANLNSVILNQDVFVEKSTSLKNTIVMPNSIVSNSHAIQNAIINKGVVYTVQ